VQFRDLPRVLGREARVGVLLGAMLATIGFGVGTLFLVLRGESGWDAARIAAVVAISLIGVCTLAATAGALMPLLAKRIGIDPAVVSSPFITTTVDASGLVIYFLVARLLLADLIGG
jgi:magnesium transporter